MTALYCAYCEGGCHIFVFPSLRTPHSRTISALYLDAL
jgi:hypothetical protein